MLLRPVITNLMEERTFFTERNRKLDAISKSWVFRFFKIQAGLVWESLWVEECPLSFYTPLLDSIPLFGILQFWRTFNGPEGECCQLKVKPQYRRVPLVLFYETVIHHFHTSVRGNSGIKTNIIKHHHKSSTTTLCNLSSIPCSCRYRDSDGVGDFEFYWKLQFIRRERQRQIFWSRLRHCKLRVAQRSEVSSEYSAPIKICKRNIKCNKTPLTVINFNARTYANTSVLCSVPRRNIYWKSTTHHTCWQLY